MIFARGLGRITAGLSAAPLLALTATALLPEVGVVIAVLFWLALVGWAVAVLAPAARRAAPWICDVVRSLARLAPVVHEARRSWWLHVWVAVARLRLWTGGGMQDRRRLAPRALGASRSRGRAAAITAPIGRFEATSERGGS